MKSETISYQGTTGAAKAARARWMVVDDNEGILNLMALLLSTFADVAVYRFRSPKDALEAFKEAPTDWELVVTDLEMPNMSGIELCQCLHRVMPQLKVLLATGSGIITGAEAKRSGFCGLLPKPFPLTDLQHVLESADVINHGQVTGAASHALACPTA